MPCPLDGYGQIALVTGAHASLAARINLAPLADEATQACNILIVYDFHLVHAEAAHAPAWRETSPSASAGRTASPSSSSSSHRHQPEYLSFNLKQLFQIS